MRKVASVIGGTCGIGAAISRGLAAEGHSGAANCTDNDTAAARFTEEGGIPTDKWTVDVHAACVESVAKVEAEPGAIDMLANTASITRNGIFHKTTRKKWDAVITTKPNGLFHMTHPVRAGTGMCARKFGRAKDDDVLNQHILPQIPFGRLSEPEEIARCVVLPTSDEARFINGAKRSANGGQVFS